MALVPHKITALAESDAEGTDGKNIVAGAVVSLYDTDGSAVTLFDSESGTNGSTAKQTDSTGQVVVWVTAGEYDEEVNGSIKRRVNVGGNSVISYETTESLQSSRPNKTGQRAENRENNGGQYVLSESGYTALSVDIVAANGRVWQFMTGQTSYYDGSNLFYPSPYGASGAGLYCYKGNEQWEAIEEGGNETASSINLNSISNLSRPPSRDDYYSSGVGSRLWQDSGRLWYSSRVTSGIRASWSRRFNDTKGIFQAASGCIAAYYTFKVNKDYSGACLRIENEATTGETDIGFDSDGNLDIQAMNEALGGQRGRVAVWYDQSGNGHDLTATGAGRPLISTVPDENGTLSVIFETSIISGFSDDPQQFMSIPSTLSGTTDDISVSIYSKVWSSYRASPMVQLGDGANSTSVGMSAQNGVNSIAAYQNDSLRVTSNFTPQIDDTFLTATFGSSDVKMYFNDEEQETATGSATAGQSFSGGIIGGGLDNFLSGDSSEEFGGAMMKGVSIYSGEMLLLEYRNLFRALCLDKELKPQIRGRIVYDGDSIVEGDGADEFQCWPRVSMDLCEYPHRGYLVARSGGTISTQLDIQSRWLSNIQRDYEPYNINVLSIGTNDIGNGSSAAAIYSSVQTYVNASIAAGYSVALCTILPRASFTGTASEDVRQEYNQLIRDNYEALGCIGIIDWDEEGTMGTVSNADSTVYYEDGTHPTTYGYSLLGCYASYRLREIIETL